jgi:hypothetical protein
MIMSSFAVTPDGRFYGYTSHRATSKLYLLDGIAQLPRGAQPFVILPRWTSEGHLIAVCGRSGSRRSSATEWVERSCVCSPGSGLPGLRWLARESPGS